MSGNNDTHQEEDHHEF